MTETAATRPPHAPADDGAKRPVFAAMAKGFRGKCPRCGEGPLFRAYSKVTDHCTACGQPFLGHRADDAPPYITMMIVGHALAIPIVEVKRHLDPPLGLQFLIWILLATVMTLWLLPRSKGALIGLQWANRMHGFGDPDEDPEASLRS